MTNDLARIDNSYKSNNSYNSYNWYKSIIRFSGGGTGIGAAGQ